MGREVRANIGWIALSVGLVLIAVGSLLPVVMLPMMFDAPGSESNRLLIALAAAIAAFPILCVVGAVLPWLFWRRSFARWLFLPPALDLTLIVMGFVALQYFCHGNFAC